MWDSVLSSFCDVYYLPDLIVISGIVENRVSGLINPNPVVYGKKERRPRSAPRDTDEYAVEAIDRLEIFDILLCVLHLFSYGRLALLSVKNLKWYGGIDNFLLNVVLHIVFFLA